MYKRNGMRHAVRRAVQRALCAAALVAVAAVSWGDPPVLAFVSILPQQYFIERIGGDLVQVQVLVKPGQSPATYRVTPRQMDQLGRADVYFRIGVPFERSLLPKIKAVRPDLLIVDTREGVDLLDMASPHTHDVSQEPAHLETEEHAEEVFWGKDPHIWLDPVRVKIQARTIAETLIALSPAEKKRFGTNLRAFCKELDALHKKLGARLAPFRGKTFYAYHPAYGYFADAFGLRQEAVEQEGKGPGLRSTEAIVTCMKQEGIRTLFVQPQFSQRQAAAIAARAGATVVPLDPLALDYPGNLQAMADAVARALGDLEK